MRVLILATDFYTRGGIARYTATLAQALGELLAPDCVDVLPLLGSEPEGFDRPKCRILMATTNRLTLRDKVRHVARSLECAWSRYDLILCSHLALAPVAALIKLRFGTPYLVVCHGSEAWVSLPAVKRAALRRARAVLAVSGYTARAVCRANALPEDRVRVLHNAVPEALVCRLTGGRPEAEEGTAETSRSAESPAWPTATPGGGFRPSVAGGGRGPVLLSVGSLNREHAYKGVDTVIGALPRILAAAPEVRYVVAGDGDNRGHLERLAARAGVADAVKFAGEVTDAELAEHYRACDVFVLPSRSSRPVGARGRFGGPAEGEGFGRVYVEAALAGKPVVGSRDGGAAEAVLDGRTGVLVDPRSASEVADAVLGLLQSPARARALGDEGRRWALENFTLPALRRSLNAILNSLERPMSRGEAALGRGREWPQIAGDRPWPRVADRRESATDIRRQKMNHQDLAHEIHR